MIRYKLYYEIFRYEKNYKSNDLANRLTRVPHPLSRLCQQIKHLLQGVING